IIGLILFIKMSPTFFTRTFLKILYSIFAIVTKAPITKVKEVPVITGLLIVGFCVFTELLLKTKLGQDFKSVGQSQHISEVSGINVDRTRIIAVMISTVLAAWGMIIYLQDMGTLNTYNAHTNIGMFAVASILVGGASTSKANIKNALIGVVLFNAMFIMSPEIGQAVFGQALLGEYFRTFMAYGVIGAALGLYVWKANKKGVQTLDTADE
ncbi:MAG: ABC transporter permease, partial [Oscillospiraceae bacterium]